MFNDAISRNPSSWQYQKLGYYSIYWLGDELFEQKNYEEALIMYNMLIELDPSLGYFRKGKH